MQVEPGRQGLAVPFRTVAVSWVVGMVKPVAG